MAAAVVEGIVEVAWEIIEPSDQGDPEKISDTEV